MKYDVWYMRPEFFRDGILGYRWLKGRGQLPAPNDLTKTHINLMEREAPGVEALFVTMQADHWSPNGEAVGLIDSKGLSHTSMSVGDIAVEHETKKVYMVDQFGFRELEPEMEHVKTG